MKRILTNLDLGNNEILNVKNIYTKEESEQKFIDQTKLDTTAFEIGPDGKINVKNDSHTHTIDNVTGLQDALDTKVSTDQLGVPSGIATLDETGKVLSSQLPSYVDSVIEGYYDDTTGKFYEDAEKTVEITGGSGKIYVDIPTSKQYRWGGTQFTEIASGGVALGETADTAYRGDLGKIAYEHSKLVTGNPHKVTKTDIGLDKVDNTADVDKPISTAVQTALDLKLDKLNAVTGVKGSAEDVARTGDVTISKENIGLDFVENKSSAMIRGEITSQNIADALGYTPVDPKDVPAEVTPFTGATADADGSTGTVIQPKLGDQEKFLKGDGTWSTIPSYAAAGDELGLVKSGEDVTIVDGVISVNDDSHNHTIENVTGLQDALDKKVSAEDGKGLSTNDLTDELKASYDKAVTDSHTHENKTVLDGIDADKITAWDEASSKTHEHENKTVLDGVTEEKVAGWDKAVTDDHTHDNKSELDGITAEKITNWDSAGDKVHEHENKEVLDGISVDKITAYDKAVTDDHTHDNKEALDAITNTKLEGYDKAATDSHVHENKTVLDGITDENVTNWNDAVAKSHAHENKEVLDGITTEKITAYDKAVTDDHTHGNILTLNKITEEKMIGYDMAAADHHLHMNKTTLDSIEDVNVTAWNDAVTKSHAHENKTILDDITEEKIAKWDAGGSSYTAGEGIAISDDNAISTNFTNAANAEMLTGSTKLVTSDSTVGTLSDIGDTIKEDKSLVTLDELNAKLQKTGSSITFGKMFVTNDYDGISESKEPYSDFKEIKKCTSSFPYRDDYNDMTLYWEDSLYSGTMTSSVNMYLHYSDNTGTANRATGSFNVNPMKYGVTLTATKTVLPHYDSAGNLSLFACGYTADAKLLMCGQYVRPSKSSSGYLSFMPVRLTISDSSWTNDTISEIANTFECNFSELNGGNPYKLFMGFQYSVGETLVKKSFIYDNPASNLWSVDLEYDNTTSAFTGTDAQYIKTQTASNIKTVTVGYFPPVKFKDVYVMGRRNNYQAFGTPIMVSHDNCKTWEDTTYSTDPPAEYASISISSSPSSLWDETVQCNGQISCIDDTIIIARVNGNLVYSEDGISWHAGYFGYNTTTDDAETDTLSYLSEAYISEGTIITKSNDNTFILEESQDINRFIYNYGVFSNASSYTRKLCYSSDGKVFRYARYQKADDTVIKGTSGSSFSNNMYGPGKVGTVLFARLNSPGSDLIENSNNANKNYFPIYSEDGGKHWKLGKMFNTAGEDVTETDTTNYNLPYYQFTAAGNHAYMHQPSSMTENHWYTTDGINWHPIIINTTDGKCKFSNIVYLNGMYIAINAADSSYSDILWSEDGITFTSGVVDAEHSTFSYTHTNPTSLRDFNFSQDVRFVNNKYIVCITNGYAISDDGKTWIIMQKYIDGSGTLPGFMGPIYRDGKYIFGCKEGSQASSAILFVTTDLINYTTYAAPVENDAQYLNNTPMLIDGKIAMWSSSAASGIGCIESTIGEFDFSPACIRMGEDHSLFSYSLLYGGLRGDTKLRYFALSDNQDASTKTQHPYVLYQSSDGEIFTATKLTTEKCPYNLFNCYPGYTGYLVYGNYSILTNSDSGSSSSSFTENFCGASHGKYGGIIVNNSGEFIGVSYKQKDSYTNAAYYSWSTSAGVGQPFSQNGSIMYNSYNQFIYVTTITTDGYKSSKGYSLEDDQFKSLKPGNILDFYMPIDGSYCVYLTAKGIYYKDFVKNVTTKATVTDKNKSDVTDENVGYKFIAIDKNVLFVLGTPTTIATANQYLVSSTDIMGDDNSRVLNDANSYTDTAIASLKLYPDFSSSEQIANAAIGSADAVSGTYTATDNCYLVCFIPGIDGDSTTTATARISVTIGDDTSTELVICSANSSGVGSGNMVMLKAGTIIKYMLKANDKQSASIIKINCI